MCTHTHVRFYVHKAHRREVKHQEPHDWQLTGVEAGDIPAQYMLPSDIC